MGRPKQHDLPDYMTWDSSNRVFTVRNPLSGKKRSWADEEQARAAAKAVSLLVETERQREALSVGRPTLSGLVTKWMEDRFQFMPWSEGTKRNYVAKLNRIKRELGARPIALLDCMFLEEWIESFTETADTFNDWRYVFVLLLKFAVSRKLADTNEAEKIEERSTSKKIAANKKQRSPLDLDGFRGIHEKAAPWLRLAMEESLVTLQGRQEVCDMQHAHHRDGWLYVIRHKVSGDSDMAFIRIAITPQIEDFQRRSRLLDDTASPYIIHRKPDSRRREWLNGKPHWTYITGDYLTKAFAEARDQIAHYSSMPANRRPSFHEVRGLGARIYQDRGTKEGEIQSLMSHSNPRTTQIYLDGGVKMLTDDDYHQVAAPLVMRDLLR